MLGELAVLLMLLLAQLPARAARSWELMFADRDEGVELLAGLPLRAPVHALAVDAEEAGLARPDGAATAAIVAFQ